MHEKKKIVEYRERLDKTLTSQDLVDENSIRKLVRNQLIQSSAPDTHGFIDSFLENRTAEVSEFLDTLRSASKDGKEVTNIDEKHQRGWKLKQDNDDFRVMYREGPEGTPFHKLLVEGYIDGPLDVCLCLSWEAALFKKWWPQFHVPPFKIISCNCLQEIRIGEQIIGMRVKVAWPLSARETILHYFKVEYFKDDLIIVLLKSISDPEGIDLITHGFNGDAIPAASDFVRIDCVGGFVLQKVTPNISYFRTIATMDIKLDYVPPSLINFLSRQIIGSGFKLYKKAVVSIAKGDDKEFSKALKDPLYVRVREGLLPENKSKKTPESEALESEKSARPSLDGHAIKLPLIDTIAIEQVSSDDSLVVTSSHAGTPISSQTYNFEIEEVALEQKPESADKTRVSHAKVEVDNVEQYTNSMEAEPVDYSTRNSTAELSNKEKPFISPEVQDALRILDNAISMVRKGFSPQNWSGFASNNPEVHDSKRAAKEVRSSLSDNGSDDRGDIKVPESDHLEVLDDDDASSSGFYDIRYDKQDSPLRELNHKQISPTSPKRHSTIVDSIQDNVSITSGNIKILEAPVFDTMSKDSNEITVTVNGKHKGTDNDADRVLVKQEKQRRCCLYFFSARK